MLEWCQQEFGEHVFKPQLVILNGDPYTFDSVHTQYSNKVNLYVPFFNYTYQVYREFRMRAIPQNKGKTLMLRVLMFYMKLLAFLDVDVVRNRFNDIKRVFQSDIQSDFWTDFEAGFLNNEANILKWSVSSNMEDTKLIFAINRHLEKSVLLIDEQLRPIGEQNDNLGTLIEGVQRLEKLQREEYEYQCESKMRTYPQLQFLTTVLMNLDIVTSAFAILVSQCDKLKYGCDDFLGSMSFVEYFYQKFDEAFIHLVDTEANLDRLCFHVSNVKPEVKDSGLDADRSQGGPWGSAL